MEDEIKKIIAEEIIKINSYKPISDKLRGVSALPKCIQKELLKSWCGRDLGGEWFFPNTEEISKNTFIIKCENCYRLANEA